MHILVWLLVAQASALPCWRALSMSGPHRRRVSAELQPWLLHPETTSRRVKVSFLEGVGPRDMLVILEDARVRAGLGETRVVAWSAKQRFLGLEAGQGLIHSLLVHAKVARIEQDVIER